ncbi:MAG: hypothetical protein WD009_05025 [Phycisphaeraceae bacterium]
MSDELNRQELEQWVLERGLTRADIDRAAAIAEHLEHDAAFAEALRDYDRLRELLAEHDQQPAAEPSGGWRAFERRVVAGASGGAGVAGASAPRRGWWRPALALAAAVALAAGGWWAAMLYDASPQVPSHAAEDHRPSYLPEPVYQHVGVFDRMADVFGDRTRWVAFTNGEPALGLSEQPVPDTARLLVLRLTMARNGAVLSQADVVIVPGQRAELELPLRDGQRLRYDLHASDGAPAQLGVWARLEDPAGGEQTLAALATNLRLQSEQVTAAGRLTTQAGDYELTLGFREATHEAAR